MEYIYLGKLQQLLLRFCEITMLPSILKNDTPSSHLLENKRTQRNFLTNVKEKCHFLINVRGQNVIF